MRPEVEKDLERRVHTQEDPEFPEGEGKIETRPKNHVWIKLFILLFIISISAILYKTGLFGLFLHRERVLAFLDSLGPLSFFGFVVLQATQVVLAPIPGEVTGLIGGYAYGPYLGVALSTTGLVLGSYVAFALSKAFGRPFVDKFVNKALMDRFDYLLHHKGLFLIFLFFLMPGFPKDYFCFILGLGHLSTMEFLLVSTVGRLFGTILLTLGGGFIRCQQYGRLYILIGVALVIVLLAMAARKKIENLFRMWHLKTHNKA